jgi:hypothetical protein
MAELLMVLVFLSAGLSLVSYVYCWQDITSGRPHILALRQITSIMDRNRLNAQYGQPEPGFYYTLTPAQIATLTSRFRLFYLRECAAEGVCMLGVWRFISGSGTPDLQWIFVFLAITCQGINFIYSIWLLRKWRDQLQEEIQQRHD